ncbi:MAG: class II aldolase/adducin family protein [Verrucomicrobiota bacterium]|nr:class II aldolase/adducin family protein [Verrucomicrobiota bacterium]
MSETGSVKFSCDHEVAELAPFPGMAELNACRAELRKLGMLGVDANGIGFGNLSIRDGATDHFYITGSATGGQATLKLGDYACVYECAFERNWLSCTGGTVASSEALTHAALYRREQNIGAVIHGHDHALWTRLLDQVPTTAAAVDYGTAEMAREVERLFAETDVRERQIFIMAGHSAGFVTFGTDLSEALRVLKNHTRRRGSG